MSREIRACELTALKEIAEMLNSTNDMDQMLGDVLAKLLQVTGFSTGWIFMMDDTSDNLCVAAHNLPQALNARNQAVMCGSECWCVDSFKQNKLNRAVNIIECSRITYAVAHHLGDSEGISHHATVPLTAGKDRFGLLNVAEAGKESFSGEELALLQAVAYQIGTAIKRIRLYQAQELNAVHYAKLGDVIQQIHAIQDINQLPLLAVKCIGDTFNWQHVSLFIYEQRQLSLRAHYTDNQVKKEWQLLGSDQAGPVSTAFRDNRLVMISDSDKEPCPSLSRIGIPPFASAAAIPLRIRNRPFGVLFISSQTRKQFDGYQQDFMYSLGDHFTISVENLRVYEQQRELARMEERNRMARDLHDSVIQKVFSLSFLAKGAETVLAGKDPIVERSLQEIRQLSQEALKEMRTLIWQLRPAGLEHGLLTALKQYGQSMDLIVNEQAEGLRELPRQVEEALWRIGQEALNNVKKHAGTNTVNIHLVKSEQMASLEITDQGTGFSAGKRKGQLTMGMISMRERAETLGGELSIQSGPGMPTTVKATIPIAAGQPLWDKE
ncbi:GAF domain-containing sensor histidine kinase [Paenibacillus alkaliterrae]|uniref:GAF domain-containing sensor histidine kinase n=1 Tax=Paenibacillus alkaliterrae TaxID=320909 RepID=UPI001F3C8009|nr:GAF domain-containing sensor histidine kinase [Paenibacillus alkaliterrae]MCF2940982.1 GAF domain-containing sensor histidine kinase [Paenibacillus alkaliterrae]